MTDREKFLKTLNDIGIEYDMVPVLFQRTPAYEIIIGRESFYFDKETGDVIFQESA